MASKLWEQLIGEPQRPYEAFRVYLESPKPRPLPDKFAALTGLKPDEILHYGEKFAWMRRARSYDDHWNRVRDAYVEKSIERTAKEIESEHREIMHAARDILHAEMHKMLKTVKSTTREVFSPRDLITLAKTVIEVDRLLIGKSTSNVQTSVDFASMSEAEFDTIYEITERHNAAKH